MCQMSENDIDFEGELWKAADRLRKKMEVHEYKHIVLGLIFLRYLSFAFEERKKELEAAVSDPNSEEYVAYSDFRNQAIADKDRYLSARFSIMTSSENISYREFYQKKWQGLKNGEKAECSNY